jgi:hypothetical protein
MKNFLSSWDDRSHPKNTISEQLYCTAHGNVNTTGVAGDYKTYLFSRHQLQFRDSLETGVKELVLLLVEDFEWITYTSCEGHHYGYSSIDPVERRVGIIPRSSEEADNIRSVLDNAANKVNPVFVSRGVEVAINSGMVASESEGYPVIKLYFHALKGTSWQSYFEQLEPLYRAFIIALRQQHSLTREPVQPT